MTHRITALVAIVGVTVLMVVGCSLTGQDGNEEEIGRNTVPGPHEPGSPSRIRVVPKSLSSLIGQWRVDPALTPGFKELKTQEAKKVEGGTWLKFRWDGTFQSEASGLEERGDFEVSGSDISLTREPEELETVGATQHLVWSKDRKEISMNSGDKTLVFTRKSKH